MSFNDVLETIPKDSLFLRWLRCFPTAEPPKSFILFSAISMLGAALGRRVYLDQDVHILYPMLNLLLIGPSGIGKSTSIERMGFRLVEQLPDDVQPQIIKGKATPEKLHEDLVVQPHAIVFASELANFFSRSKYMEDMIPYVTQLLDYEKTSERRTKGGNVQTIVEPAVTIVGGSTVDWLQSQLPDSAASGGFLARFLILKEDHKGQRVPFPRSSLSTAQWDEIELKREKCHREFNDICTEFSGPVRFANYGASDAYGVWYQLQQPATGHLAPFSARAGEFVLRLSMLLALSCHRNQIYEEDVRAAISLYDYATAKLQEVVVPFSQYGKMVSQVLGLIGEHPVTEISVKRAMRNSASAMDVKKVLDNLLETREIARTATGDYIRRS